MIQSSGFRSALLLQGALLPSRPKGSMAGEVGNLLPPRRAPSPDPGLVNSVAAFAAAASKDKVLEQCLHTLDVCVLP